MAGNGRKAKGGAVPLLKQDGQLRGRELGDPELLLGHNKQWNPQVLKYWQHIRTSPQAQRMGTELDWDYMEQTMVLLNLYYDNHRWELAAELRQRMAEFGFTPASRVRLKFDTPGADDLNASQGGGFSHRVDREDFMRRRRAVGG